MALYPEQPAPARAGGDDRQRDLGEQTVPIARVNDRLLARIAAVLAAHQPDQDEWCVGCRGDGIMTFYPCPIASWAIRYFRGSQ